MAVAKVYHALHFRYNLPYASKVIKQSIIDVLYKKAERQEVGGEGFRFCPNTKLVKANKAKLWK